MDLNRTEAGELREHLRDLARETQAMLDALGDKPDADVKVDARVVYELDGRASDLCEFLESSGIAQRAARASPYR